ncbi:hypothetical protein AMJ80_04160 [bacterium SM23_31]|nr:MAG: hypothetical protein AMJ80_04160 [bacterium SM23_31]
MQVQRSFLIGISIICLSIFLSFFNCSNEIEFKTVEIEPLTDVLTLELTIGESSNLQDEYIIAEPRPIMVNNLNDILVVDEGRVKVFDAGGKEKHIFGRVGQGPGEFVELCGFFLSPQGYLTAMDAGGYSGGRNNVVGYRINVSSRLSNHYNLFSPDYSLVEKKMLMNVLKLEEYLDSINIEEPRNYIIRKLFFINEIERVYEIRLNDNDPESDIKYYTIILYENENTVKPIVHTIMPGTGATGTPGEYFGTIQWALIPERKVMYVTPFEDEHNERTVSRFTIHVISLDTFEDTKIYKEYTPILVPEDFKESFINMEKERAQRMSQRGIPVGGTSDYKKNVRIYKALKYFPSIYTVRMDRNYAFLFTVDRTSTTRMRNENLFAYVIDLNTGESTSAAKFLFIPNVINNEYAYWIGVDEEEFPQIEKYRIDPAVYGK